MLGRKKCFSYLDFRYLMKVYEAASVSVIQECCSVMYKP